MGVKITEWKLKMSENVGSVMSKLNSAADKVGSKMEAVQNKFNPQKIAAFTNEIPIASRAATVLSSGATLAGAAVAAIGVAMFKAGEQAKDYEQAMAKVNATAQLSPVELEKLKEKLVDIGSESGGNFNRIPDAFEKINSRVNDVAESLDIVKIATQGAKAGFADIDVAANALSATLSIVGPRDTALGIMDTLLKSKAVGAGEFADFANYLPALISAGDPIGVNHNDVAGLYSYMTTKYSSGSDAAMYLQNAFTAIGKSQVQGGLAKNGLQLFDKKGNMRDLGEFFTEMSAKLKKMSPEVKSKFLESVGLRDVQAKNAFTVLSEDAEKLKSVMDQVRNSTGELNRQLDATGNKTRSWAEIGDKISAGMLHAGDVILPIVDKMVKGAEAWYEYFTHTRAIDKVEDYARHEKTAEKYATAETKRLYPTYAPMMFENRGQRLTGKAKEVYDHAYNVDIAKLTGTMYGGDYDKWRANQISKLTAFADEQKAKKLLEKTEADNKKKKGKNITEGIDSVSSGGHRVINIQFGKLNENIIIKSETLKEGTAKVVENLEEMLVRIITGAETTVANQ